MLQYHRTLRLITFILTTILSVSFLGGTLAWAEPEKPTKLVTRPNERHFIRKVTQSSTPKDKNTVIESRVDISRDIRDINDGKAKKGSESGVVTWTVNGRTYGTHTDGQLYPLSGSGFHQLNRSAYKALGVYNKFGDTKDAKAILDNMKVSSSDRDAALKAYKAG